jgi:transcriptional antiterminator RfaH
MDRPTKNNWYAIYTKPRQEERATSNLRAWNLETCSPKLRESRYCPSTQRPIQIVKPLFPSYIFACFDASSLLHKVWFTRGVHSVVSFGGRPLVVSDEIILLIRSQIDPEGFVTTGEQIAIGDKVRIKGGPLHDFVGVFEGNANAARRVKLLLSAVNYQCRIDVERDLIEKVS